MAIIKVCKKCGWFLKPSSIKQYNWSCENCDEDMFEFETHEEKSKPYIKNLWQEFGDVPMNPETECIESDFYIFPAGTHREEIWHWFEEEFGIPVSKLMYEFEEV